jgi:hypothetical protein
VEAWTVNKKRRTSLTPFVKGMIDRFCWFSLLGKVRRKTKKKKSKKGKKQKRENAKVA